MWHMQARMGGRGERPEMTEESESASYERERERVPDQTEVEEDPSPD